MSTIPSGTVARIDCRCASRAARSSSSRSTLPSTRPPEVTAVARHVPSELVVRLVQGTGDADTPPGDPSTVDPAADHQPMEEDR